MRNHRSVSLALMLGVCCATGPAFAQLAPTGDHYAGRPSDTGFAGIVNGSGGYSTSVALDLPPVRGGLPIPLSVVYGARGVGAAGLGWDVPLSYVRDDTTFARRRPVLTTVGLPQAREQVSVSLAGQVVAMVPTADHSWAPHDGSRELRLVKQGATWVLYDGEGRTYSFAQSGVLSGSGLWLLSSVTGVGGATLQLTYAIGQPSLPGGFGVSIDLSTISYNVAPGASCAKHLLQLVYNTASTTPLSMEMLGTRVLARMRTLGNIYVRSAPSCGASSVLLRNYAFSYAPDVDTGLPRLASVTVSARGDSSDHSVLPVASYGYGSATSRDLIDNVVQKVLAYVPTQTIALPAGAQTSNIGDTLRRGTLPPGISGTPLGTTQVFTDVTGDGRPDFIFTATDGRLWSAPSLPGDAGTTQFGAAFPLEGASLPAGPFDLGSASNALRYTMDLAKPWAVDRQWRMAIDMNGDGRIDIVDAAEQPGVWVVYFNSPGPAGQPVWVRRTISLVDIRARLGPLISAQTDLGDFIPLSSRKTAPREKTFVACAQWNGTGWHPYPEGWNNGLCQTTDGLTHSADFWVTPGPLEPELTYVEWELRDVNGDGYPDLVFDKSPADSVLTHSPADAQVSQQVAVVAYGYTFGIFGPSEVDALLNVAGVRIDDASNVFSVGIILADDPHRCGFEEWQASESSEMQTLFCGLADVNGDGIVDRVESIGSSTTARLGSGTYPSGGFMDVTTTTIALPGPLSVQVNQAHTVCTPMNTSLNASNQAVLRDVTGDGIPDYLSSPGQNQPWTVAIGTGTGFLPPIPVTAPTDVSLASWEFEACDGGSSITRGGLFDIDGDGKPEKVQVDGGVLKVAVLVGEAGTPRAPEAGKLITVDNGYGAVTRIDYRSAKEDPTAPHLVPFPEIVASQMQTTGHLGLGGTLDPTLYAYGAPIFFFDPFLDGFRMAGYGRTVTLQAVPGGAVPGASGGQGYTATITDASPPPSWNIGLGATDRFARYLRAGQTTDETVLAGALGGDPWALLGDDLGSDARRIAAVHYDYSVGTRFFSEADTHSLDCVDVEDPFDWGTSWDTSGFDACTSHGFVYPNDVDAWRGTAAPPSDANVETHTTIRAMDDYGHATSVLLANDVHRGEDDVCVDTTYAGPTGTGAPVVSAPATRKVWDCAKGGSGTVFALDFSEYDGLPVGTVGAGLPTSHTVDRLATDTGRFIDQIRQLDVTYDAGGNPAKIVRKREDGAMLTTTLDYDPFGLAVVHARVAASGLTPLDTYTTLDPISLDALTVQDENGTLRGARYDAFGRPVMRTTTAPSGVTGALSTTSYAGFGGGLARSVSTTRFTDPVPLANVGGATGRVGTTFLDELGRARYTQILLGADYGGAAVIAGARSYDGLGRVQFAADPYPQTQDGATAYGTTVYYATDGQPACSIRGNGPQPFTAVPDATSERFPTFYTHAFSGNLEMMGVQDAASLTSGSPQQGAVAYSIASGAGRLLFRSTWQNGIRIEHAAFGEDHLGQLASMTRYLDAVNAGGGGVTTWTKDSLGQTLSLQEPGAPARARTFSRFGELTSFSWTPPAPEPPHAMIFRYDALGRLVHREEQNGGTTDPDTVKDLFYDAADAVSPQVTPANLRGRLAYAVAPTGDVYFSYDGFGNVAARTFTDSSGTAYVDQQTFHGDGSLAAVELDLPDDAYRAERVSYAYDSAGRVRSATYSDGSVTQPIFTGQTRDAFGRIRAATFGQASYAASYADTGRRLVQNVGISSTLGSRQIVWNGFDPVGRELSRTEGTGPTISRPTTTSGYDALGRLATSLKRSGQGTLANRSFSYDALGNAGVLKDSLGALGATVSDAPGDPDRMCFVFYGSGSPPPGPGCNVTYDAAGNVTSEPTRGPTRVLGWYNSGAVRTIRDASGAEATFRYGALGELQELDLVGGGSDTRHDRRYGGRIVRHDQGATQVVSRQFGAPGVTAIRRGPDGPWVFQLAEPRGTRFTVDQNGAFLQDVDYQPFGEAASGGALPGTAQYSSEQWNGGDALATFGLVQLGARIYDPVVGRFLSRDPILVPRTAATTNPYSFAMNDPVNLSDPSGMNPEGQSDDSDPGDLFDHFGDGLAAAGHAVVQHARTAANATRYVKAWALTASALNMMNDATDAANDVTKVSTVLKLIQTGSLTVPLKVAIAIACRPCGVVVALMGAKNENEIGGDMMLIGAGEMIASVAKARSAKAVEGGAGGGIPGGGGGGGGTPTGGGPLVVVPETLELHAETILETHAEAGVRQYAKLLTTDPDARYIVGEIATGREIILVEGPNYLGPEIHGLASVLEALGANGYARAARFFIATDRAVPFRNPASPVSPFELVYYWFSR